MKQLAVDFGTTNTVVAVWREASNKAETLYLPGLSVEGSSIPLIPSQVYVNRGDRADIHAGHEVQALGLDLSEDERFFSSFKRAIGSQTRPLPRSIDGTSWDEIRAGEALLRRVLAAVKTLEGPEIDELVLTVPIDSFERYLDWLQRDLLGKPDPALPEFGRVRIVDESTAAALGYEIRMPGELVLVFDFGGGTLDISLVRMPLAEESSHLLVAGQPVDGARGRGGSAEARVIAKAGRVLGGDDIDHWMLNDLLERNQLPREAVGDSYAQLKMAVEAAKIRLSTHESAEISVFDPDSLKTYRGTYTRSQLEDLLDRHEFFSLVQRTLDKVMRSARTRGIFAEDIGAVLLVGGSSQIPSVRRMLRASFGPDRLLDNKPFEAVAHGAVGLAVGVGLDDFIYHSYAIRHLSPISGRHEWEEVVPAGTRYPLTQPITLILTAHRDGQEAIELVIGEVAEGSGSLAEVTFGERSILLVDGGSDRRNVAALNDREGARTVAHLDPPGRAGRDRIEVQFLVDANRTLCVTVLDLETRRTLLRDQPVVALR